VLAGLSKSYDKGNIVVDYFGTEVYFHAMPAKALGGDVSLTSNSDR
jgi:hypothetical protein